VQQHRRAGDHQPENGRRHIEHATAVTTNASAAERAVNQSSAYGRRRTPIGARNEDEQGDCEECAGRWKRLQANAQEATKKQNFEDKGERQRGVSKADQADAGRVETREKRKGVLGSIFKVQSFLRFG